MRRQGHLERAYHKEQAIKQQIARKQWLEVIGVLAIGGGAVTFFFIALCHAMGVL